MWVEFDSTDERGGAIHVEASVFPRTVLRDPSSEVKPAAVLVTIREQTCFRDHQSLTKDLDKRLREEAIAEARRQVMGKVEAAA